MNPYQWPSVGHNNSNDFQHLGWCYFVPPPPTVQVAAPSVHNLPVTTPGVQLATQVPPQDSQAMTLAGRGESQVRQDTWSLAERRINPPTRRVRFVEANSRLPVAEDDDPGHVDITRAVDNFHAGGSYIQRLDGPSQETLDSQSIRPAHNAEVIMNFDPHPASVDEAIGTAYGGSDFYPGAT